jgi:hypothetical protein
MCYGKWAQKQKIYICHEWFKIKKFFAHKNKLIWIAKVNYQRIANFQISQIVTGKLRT